MRKKAVVLFRVSTDEQDFMLQKNKNRSYCKDNDIEIVGEYTEFDVSGYKSKIKETIEIIRINKNDINIVFTDESEIKINDNSINFNL